MSLAHALSLADAIRDKITHGASDPANLATTPEELRAARIARSQVEKSLDDTITVVQGISKFLDANPVKPPPRPEDHKLGSLKEHRVAQSAARIAAAATDDPLSNAQKLVNGMSGTSLQDVINSLDSMTKAIGPIITTFDQILGEAYLDQFSATLDTAPVVGLKGNQIYYVKTSADANNNTAFSWAVFSSLPPKVTITAGDVVHFFPYNGDFCLSVNKTVWKKVHTNPLDPALQHAVDNWPAMYSQDWTPLGDCLPVANFAAIVPFTSVDTTHHAVSFQLVALTQDGGLQWMNSDQLTPNSIWTPLKYDSSSSSNPKPPATSPAFTKIAYWSGGIVGVDEASNSWDVTISFNNNTYQVANQTAIDPVTEFTATEEGPVGLHSDGYLWKRVVAQIPDGPGSSDKKPVVQWLKWLPVVGITNIGVASPGVILDMKTLIASLKSTYIDVQTSIYPAVSTISAFADVHATFLDDIADDATDFNNAPDGSDKQAVALKAGKASIIQAQVWAPIVAKSVNSCQSSVNNMGLQIPSIRNQLSTQMTILAAKLVALQVTLQREESQLSQLNAAIWGMVAIVLSSITMTIAGLLVAPLLLYVGGPLLIGGIVALVVMVFKRAELQIQISQTRSQMSSVGASIQELQSIIDAMGSLDDDYGDLNQWWGDLADLAKKLGTYDNAIAQEIGYGTLADTSAIETGQKATGVLSSSCQAYLDVLNRQGIIHPNSLGVTNITSHFSKTPNSPVHQLLQAANVPISGHAPAPVFNVARGVLIERDQEAYLQVMNYAQLLQMDAFVDVSIANVTSGLWLDAPKLRGAADIWLSSSQNFVNSSGVLDAHRALGNHSDIALKQANAVDSALDKARGLVISSLEETVSLASTLVDWSKQYPTAPADSEQLEDYRAKAVRSVENAQQAIATANDYLRTSSAQVATYDQGLAAHRPSEKHLSRIIALKSSSGLLSSHVDAWVQMVLDLQTNLSTIHNVLTEVWFSLRDPKPYAAFIQGNWSRLLRDVQDILAIVKNSATPSISSHSTAALSPAHQIVQAVSPATTLGAGILSQTHQATSFFNELDALLKLPSIGDIIGYWNADSTHSQTLRDIIVSIRSEYVNIVGLEYNVIQALQNVALVQGYRARTVAASKHPIQPFAQSSLVAVRSAINSIDSTNARLKDSVLDFEIVLTNIDLNIQKVERQIANLDVSVDEGDKERRASLTAVVATTIATIFASTLSFGSSGPTSNAVEAALQQGSTAAAIAGSIAAVLNTLTLSDVVDVVESLKTTRSSLADAINSLRRVQPSFKNVVKSVTDVNAAVDDMYKKLLDVQDVVRIHADIVLTHEDAEDIAAAWQKIQEDTQVWFDAVNKQGIVPGWVSN